MKIKDINEYSTDPKLQKELDRPTVKPDPRVAKQTTPNYHKQWPGKENNLVDLSKETRPPVIDRVNEFFQKFEGTVPPGYKCEFDTLKGGTKPEYSAQTNTSNGIRCFITGTGTGRILNMFINGISPTNKDPIFTALADAGFAFGKSATSNTQISVTPSNKQNIDLTLKEFWSMVQIIESLGNNFNKRAIPDSGAKLNTKMNSLEYYLGTAGLVFVATRFKMPSMLPRGNTSTNRGTFDINPGLLTRGITENVWKIQSGKIPVQPITTVFAVPPDLIVDKAVEMIKKDGDKLKITAKTKDDILNVAKMIRTNLIIIKCTEDEKNRIESVEMPSTWTSENKKVLAKFQKLKIPVIQIEDGKRLAETNN